MRKSQPAPQVRFLARHLFGERTLAEWNPGTYHDSYHAMYVAEVAASMAASRGGKPDESLLLAQVALLHDVDPCRPAGTPAAVFRTLEWMWVRKETLQDTLAWDDTAFDTAMALIARTDFPFDLTPRCLGTSFDGHSPYTLYRDLIGRLPVERRQAVFEDAQILRFADQCANYCRDFETASLSVDQLSQELSLMGRATTRWDLDTANFLDSLATDAIWDARLQGELGIQGRVFSRDELLCLLPASLRGRLERNQDLFRRERHERAG